MGGEDQDGIEESDLHAFLDGALDPTREALVRDWLIRHPDAMARVGLYAEQQLALVAASGEPSLPRLPVLLVRDLERSLRRGIWRQRAARAAAMVAMLGAGWVANDLLRQPVFAGLPIYAQEAADAHEVFANDPARPVEIPGTRPDEIRRWLSAKLGENVPVPELHPIGLRLVGARVMGGNNGAIGQLLYEDAMGRRMTLSLSADENLAPRHPLLSQYDGLEVGCWRSEDFALAVVSIDLPMELEKLAGTIDIALHPSMTKNPL